MTFTRYVEQRLIVRLSITRNRLAIIRFAAGLHSIGVHNLSPGMVLTDLLLMDASPVGRRFIKVLADEPETVAAAVVPQIRTIQACLSLRSASIWIVLIQAATCSGQVTHVWKLCI